MGKLLLAGLVAGLSSMAINAAQAVEIEYWQYIFESRVKTMDTLIENFEKANPDIKVKQVTFPYDDYQTRVIAAKMAGKSPDVMQLFYGWLDKFAAGGILQPLPQDVFPHDKIESEFFPIVGAMKRGGEYYGLPTAVRSLALFYNKKLFEEAGLDPNTPPKNLDELVDFATKTTKRDDAGNLVAEGITLDMPGQDQHWWREVLVRQFGGQPYTDNDRKVAYNDAAGEKALAFYTGLQTEHKVGEVKFMDEGHAAFRAGKAAMTVDGTFRLAAFNTIKDFEWGVTELPANADGVRSNYASYFANGISASADGEKLEAAAKFLDYISSPEAMEIWLKGVGELPARRSVALTEANLADPVYGPFLKGLEYAHTTMFVDELKQRQIAVDMANRVILQNQPVKESLDEAAKAEQTVLDAAK
ncbi:extracellular solute-binding protein [Falsochrobactrum sp. TDYN1]|uniref:Extracellular solute-binding protein n=1 Tax=Falsochrobactrum tianjinense TaxID=2706015 RepID=A0A949PLH8_9HYPH|nr:extracellular solute-binding protein [Falsochrobactrum sp. TDYN1]MBV2143466.1 extracellular solute-binding protein [Falsochrobactrum sp. TDYN1]